MADNRVNTWSPRACSTRRRSWSILILPTIKQHYIGGVLFRLRGIDVDQPRNLAKSVTVE
jgi:hypothetical protein